jgi:hypothetical protein
MAFYKSKTWADIEPERKKYQKIVRSIDFRSVCMWATISLFGQSAKQFRAL